MIHDRGVDCPRAKRPRCFRAGWYAMLGKPAAGPPERGPGLGCPLPARVCLRPTAPTTPCPVPWSARTDTESPVYLPAGQPPVGTPIAGPSRDRARVRVPYRSSARQLSAISRRYGAIWGRWNALTAQTQAVSPSGWERAVCSGQHSARATSPVLSANTRVWLEAQGSRASRVSPSPTVRQD